MDFDLHRPSFTGRSKGSRCRAERRVSVTPDPSEAFTPDITRGVCSGTEGQATPEPGLQNGYALVTMLNDDRPTTPDNQSTNSFVTMSRYRVDFIGLSKSVSLPSIDGAGQTVGLAPSSSGIMTVLVLDFATMEYIRSHYPAVGNPEGLTQRATITTWGKDSFQADVKTEPPAVATLVIENYDRCSN